ncbi:MAG: histidine kinase, partial [Bacteroidaceae bacterium]|nr:histidine kinase [Bacteroidaceae bacterium]
MKNIYWLIVLAVLFSACSRPHRFVIGVSQCSDDEWRGKMNREMLRESSLYDGTVAIEIKTANDDTEQQKRDILYFMEKKVDVLVVAPNEAVPLTSVVEKAFES